MRPVIDVLDPGPLTTVQDLGRVGHGAWGIGSGGAADRGSLRLANRLVGNPESAAALETLLGGLTLRFTKGALVAVTGAEAAPFVDDRPALIDGPQWIPDGSVLRLETPRHGLRSYVAVRGGLATEVVLGSRSVDLRGGLGRALAAGDTVAVGTDVAGAPLVSHAPRRPRADGPVRLTACLGPRDDWFTSDALRQLAGAAYVVAADSDRVGVRLSGPALERSTTAELVSEPALRGAVEVPPDGQPIVLGADHPTTIGYPVVAVLDGDSSDAAAQCRPGETVTFELRRPRIDLTRGREKDTA